MKQVYVQKITHSYDGVRPAVSELSFHVQAGEVLALIGPNGAGKSTSLRILATLQRPDSGAVLWDGRDAWAERQSVRQRIGFLGDGTALYPNMTAAGYLRFFAECYGMSDGDARRRVAELLEIFKLSSKADALISDLSKGMRQRLAIARTTSRPTASIPSGAGSCGRSSAGSPTRASASSSAATSCASSTAFVTPSR